jgi:hypothetical protein
MAFEAYHNKLSYLYYYIIIITTTIIIIILLYFFQSHVRNYIYCMGFEVITTLTVKTTHNLLASLLPWLQVILILFLSTQCSLQEVEFAV